MNSIIKFPHSFLVTEMKIWKDTEPDKIKEIEVPPQTIKLKAICLAIDENKLKRKI